MTPTLESLDTFADLEAERGVLGAVMVDNAALPSIEALLRVEHFHSPRHRQIFAAMVNLGTAGQAIEPIALIGALRDRDELEASGPEYIAGLLDGLPRSAPGLAWARRVHEKARRRGAVVLARKLIEQAFRADTDTDVLLDKLMSDVNRMLETGERRLVSLASVLPAAMKDLDTFMESGDGVTGIPTGLIDVDKVTGGLKPGLLYIVAARPSRGKSALLAQTAIHAAGEGHRALVFSMEMEPYQLAQRMLLADAGVERWTLKKAAEQRDSYEWKRVQQSYVHLSKLPVTFDQHESPTLAHIKASCRQQPVDLVVVDYLQRMTMDPAVVKASGPWMGVGENVKGLKSLARNLRVPVLAACQLTAEAEDKRPSIAMLQQAQSIISAEADLISFLHPEDLEHWKTQPYPFVNLLVDKHRGGACMSIRLSFEKAATRFVSAARGPE